MSRKIIVTGSASYLPKWWNDNKHKLFEFDIHSINTSILITKDVCKQWWFSDDFFALHPEIDKNIVCRDVIEFGMYPRVIEYDQGGTGGTMLFNVLQQLYNEHAHLKNISEVNIIGCDLIYKEGEQNHFYGNGTSDPMRLGLPLLQKNIEMFKSEYEKANIRLYNLSPQTESLLTFERRML
jgi:hypothetical protein